MRTEQMRASWNLFGIEDHEGGGGGLARCSTSRIIMMAGWMICSSSKTAGSLMCTIVAPYQAVRIGVLDFVQCLFVDNHRLSGFEQSWT